MYTRDDLSPIAALRRSPHAPHRTAPHHIDHTDHTFTYLPSHSIDQTNIDASLLCLPVFLASCQRLLVLAGKTYTTRMWCIMECFTFILMGGTTEQIEVRLLARGATEQDELISTFRDFNASDATRYLQEDTDRLLGTIEGPLPTLVVESRVARHNH